MVDAPIVAVRGEAVQEVAPEIARFSVTVAARDSDRATVLTRLGRRTDAVRAVLDSYGPAVELRETGTVAVQPEWKRSGERVSAYHASLSTTVTVVDFAALGDLMLRLADEEQTSVYGPWWALRPASDRYRAARRAAIDDAVARAREYAEAVGARLVRLLEVTDVGMSTPQPVTMAFAASGLGRGAGDGPPDLQLEPQRQTITAALEMRFTITEPAVLAGVGGAGSDAAGPAAAT